jgi:hypothetical protein
MQCRRYKSGRFSLNSDLLLYHSLSDIIHIKVMDCYYRVYSHANLLSLLVLDAVREYNRLDFEGVIETRFSRLRGGLTWVITI